MFGTIVRTLSRGVGVLPLFSSAALATTYVVDASGGGQFLDIPPAIAAAQDGDVLLVMSGNYSGFMLDKSLTIIGYGGASVAGQVTITSASTVGRAVIVGIRPAAVSVTGCPSTVVLQDLGTISNPFHVLNCNDVRLARTDVIAAGTLPQPGLIAVTTETARLEMVDGTVTGYTSSTVCACTLDGRIGIEAGIASRVHLALTSAVGGSGNNTVGTQHAGSGATALHVSSMADVIVAGGESSHFYGGEPGYVVNAPSCSLDGTPAAGAVSSGSLRESGATFVGSCCFPTVHCQPDLSANAIEGTYTPVAEDPTLRMTGTSAAGQTIQLTVKGQPGASALLYFGRQTIVQSDPNTAIELLTTKSRLVHLGALPASGEKTFSWTIPTVLAAGTFLCAQAEVTPTSGPMERTNSVPIVVR